MNLQCNLVYLRQTPTEITNMCLVQPSGDIPWEVTGNKARHALQIYIQWLKGTLNGAFEDVEEHNYLCKCVDEEIVTIKKVLNKRTLKVSMT